MSLKGEVVEATQHHSCGEHSGCVPPPLPFLLPQRLGSVACLPGVLDEGELGGPGEARLRESMADLSLLHLDPNPSTIELVEAASLRLFRQFTQRVWVRKDVPESSQLGLCNEKETASVKCAVSHWATNSLWARPIRVWARRGHASKQRPCQQLAQESRLRTDIGVRAASNNVYQRLRRSQPAG
ncbi:hypothetical protein LZ30DRAFT_30785 [Colletotrichum cereale]|nr:hypothetical protein LZ30DRAFT_30785 [Colletotrichum cereale]